MKAHAVFYLIFTVALLPFTVQAQLLSVSGYVKNQSTSEAKHNAAVFEKNSGIGTITNSEGYYRLLLNPGQRNLEISSTGFNSYSATFNLKSDTIVSVNLMPMGFRSKNETENASHTEIFIVTESIKNKQKPEE
jgi:hypothetical protein